MNQLRLIERARAHAGRVAVASRSQPYSYEDLLHRSESIAAALLDSTRDLCEARVAYLLPPGLDHIAVQWGVWRSGGIAVPLSLSATERELEYTLSDSQSSCIVTTSELAPQVTALIDRLALRRIVVNEIPVESSVVLPQIDARRRAMILYTSGTTSQPKGVVTTHACIEAQIESLVKAWHWQADDRIPLFLPLHHIHGIINVMSCALWSGACIECFPRLDVDTILHRIAEDSYTVFMAVPTIYVKLIEVLESLPDQQRTPIVEGFGRLRLMVSGSAALPASVHQRWEELTGQKLLERYGMTEIGMALSNPYDGQRRPGAVGQPLPGVEIRLVGEDQEDAVPKPAAADADRAATHSVTAAPRDSTPGEIQVRGANVFQEYWNRPETTRDAFENGWFRTGDIAVLEDGYYRIMGRSSVDIIKSGGYKLSALEIEAALLDHPAIGQCAVVGIADDTWGEVVAAAVVLRDSQSLDLDALRAWCRDRISSYKIPRKLLVVDELPRNAMGKVTKPELVQLFG